MESICKTPSEFVFPRAFFYGRAPRDRTADLCSASQKTNLLSYKNHQILTIIITLILIN